MMTNEVSLIFRIKKYSTTSWQFDSMIFMRIYNDDHDILIKLPCDFLLFFIAVLT